MSSPVTNPDRVVTLKMRKARQRFHELVEQLRMRQLDRVEIEYGNRGVVAIMVSKADVDALGAAASESATRALEIEEVLRTVVQDLE